jgi:hypothetical protein
MDINEAIIRGEIKKVQAAIKKHVKLFHPIEQVAAEKRALEIAGRMSKSEAMNSIARASNRTLKSQSEAA